MSASEWQLTLGWVSASGWQMPSESEWAAGLDPGWQMPWESALVPLPVWA